MRKYLGYGAAIVVAVLTLQSLLPHRLEEGRSTEVLGKLSHYLKARPRGVALAEVGGSFEWDTACAIRADASLDAFHLQTGIAFPRDVNLRLGHGARAWLLVFAKDKEAVAVTEVPIGSIGDVKQDAPHICIADPGGFLTVLERDDADGPPRQFILRS